MVLAGSYGIVVKGLAKQAVTFPRFFHPVEIIFSSRGNLISIPWKMFFHGVKKIWKRVCLFEVNPKS